MVLFLWTIGMIPSISQTISNTVQASNNGSIVLPMVLILAMFGVIIPTLSFLRIILKKMEPQYPSVDSFSNHAGKKLFTSIVLLLFLAVSTSLQAQSGTAFRDFNGDGLKTGAEPGVAGIIVRIYGNATLPAKDQFIGETLTGSNGTFNFTTLVTSGRAANPGERLRIEFTIPNDFECGLSNTVDFTGTNGGAYGTSVQFLVGQQSGLNFAINYPGQWVENPNPTVFVPCYAFGDPNLGGNVSSGPSLISYPFATNGVPESHSLGDPGVPDPNLMATIGEVGALYGAAFSRQSQKLFVSAVLRRHAAFGPQGPGGIYLVNPYTANPDKTDDWLDLDAIDIWTWDHLGSYPPNPGNNTSPVSGYIGTAAERGLGLNRNDPSTDYAAGDQVGKVSIGDIDISDDGRFLYIVNLYDRRIYEIDMVNPNNPEAPTLANKASRVRSWPVPDPATNPSVQGEERPWGLKYYRGKLYVGIVLSGQNLAGNVVGPVTGSGNSQIGTELRGYVYEFDPSTQLFDVRLDFSFNYGRERPWIPWGYMSGRPSRYFSGTEREVAEPIISDIEFDDEGNMLIGILDRKGHQYAINNNDYKGTLVNYEYATAGELLRANGSLINGSCVFNIVTRPGNKDYYNDNLKHPESVQGPLAVLPGGGDAIAVWLDPIEIRSGGTIRLNNTTGAQVPNSAYEVFDDRFTLDPGFNNEATPSKANGLGDVELSGAGAPIEVGNRVWADFDRDGIQDSGEPGVPGVEVQLKWGVAGANFGDLLATITTDANGNFFFNDANVPDGNLFDPGNQAGILELTDYIICIPGSEFGNGQQLNNFLVTIPNQAGSGLADYSDSDGLVQGNGDVSISLTSGTSGENNHSYDFGVIPTDYGDLPDTYGTTEGNNGPWHWLTPALKLGACVDGEIDGQPQAMAGQMVGGDDNTVGISLAGACSGNGDDENGVVFSTPMIPGYQAFVTVNAMNMTGSSAVLQAWIDFNGNGIFEANEQLTTGSFAPSGATVPNGGLTNAVLCFNVPANATFNGGAAFSRFRLSPLGGLGSGGGGVDGEVEDHKLTLAKVGTYVWHDQNNDGVQDEPASAGLNNVPMTLTWLGPDAAVGGGDDVAYTTTTANMGGVNGTYMFFGLSSGMYKITPGTPVGYFGGLEDLGGNDFKDSDAHAGVMVNINNPINLVTGENGTGDIPGSTNGFPDNQDNLSFDFNYVTADYGDLPAPYNTTQGGNGASHIIVAGLKIGGAPDGEVDGQPSGDAFGDGGDENGVSFPVMYIGQPANITVNVMNTIGIAAKLYGFIDWNKDGLFTGPNETLTLNVPNGTNGNLTLAFTVPAGAVAGMDLGARFRLSTDLNLGPDGQAPNGEVEDYLVQVCNVIVVITSQQNVTCNGGSDGAVWATVINGEAPFTYDWSNDGPEDPDDDIADAHGLSAGTYVVTVTDANGCTSTAEATITEPSAVTNVISNIDDANCLGSEDGSATATASGGVSPYDYAWSHGFTQLNVLSSTATGLHAGGYNVTVTDANGCTIVTGFEIADPTGVTLVVNAPIVNETCDESNNGSASVTASGGTAPFTFVWTGGTIVSNSPTSTASGLSAGTYLVTATDANGCLAIQTIVITQPTNLVAQIIGKTDQGCVGNNDGSATVTATGGITPYTYDWSNDGPENPDNDLATVTGLAAGTYTVTVTDANGCTTSTSVIIGTVPPLVLTLDSENENQCGHSDGSIDLTVSGGTPAYTYDWSNDGAENPDNDQDDLTGLSAGTYTVTVTDARGCSAVASVLLTCTIPASIGNYTWIDSNADGDQDPGESPLPGVVVILSGTDNNGNAVNDVQATDGSGLYLFDDLFPGSYKLTFVTPGGYVPTTPNDPQANDTNDSDAVPTMGGMTVTEVLTPGENNLDYDAGYYVPAAIGDYAWVDDNANGVQDSGEPGLEGVPVMLIGTDGQGNPVMQSTTSDVSGHYIFEDLVPGTYKLKFVVPAGTQYEITGNDLGGDDTSDSDALEAMGGMTANEVLVSGERNITYDAGFYIPASLGDYVWLDDNANGVQEAGERGIGGVTVKLQDAAGNPVTVDADGIAIVNQITNSNGFYQFRNLVPGIYKVMFINPNPAKFTLTVPNAGTDDAQDSDPTTPGLMTQTTTLGSGDNDPTLDAGLYSKAKVGNFVWEDQDGDGVQDATEPGINNVSVTLTGTDNLGNPVSLSTTTTGNGMYMFGDLVPGAYKITFGTPAGYTTTDADQGNSDARDSDAGPMGMTPVFVVESGDTILTFDAGYYLPAKIGNYTWIDANADGDQDGGESPLPGVVVILTGTTGSGEPVNQTATTDANGLYLFDNLQPGTYKLTFQTPIGNYVSTTANDVNATEATDSDADPANGGMTINEVLVSGESNLTYDAGYYEPASIGDYVWHDLDGDGIQDPNEPGIADVTVTLTGTDGQGNPVTLTTTTAPDGSYNFPNLVPGTYKLTFTTPAGGYVSSDVNEGGNDANDSDADPANGGMTANEVLTSGENNPNYDAGYYIPSEIGNYTWIDANANGIQDMGEAPISNVSVTLTGTTASGDPVSLNQFTNANGLYLFTGLEPGTYKLTFVTPAGYVATLANDVDDATDALDSDADPANGGMTVNEVLTSGESNLTYDAGYYEYASIGNYTWIDTDADGIQDPTESPLPGVTVTLTGTDGQGNPVTLTDVTDNNGLYLFDNLVPGTYKLTFTTPGGGYVPTDANQGGNDAVDSDANPLMGGMTVTEVLTSGEDNLTYDAGYYLPAKIGNYTWIDANADGDQDGGESPLPGVVVILTGTTGSGEPVNLTATTDANGLYLFDNLQPGTYKLTFQTPVGNYVSTTANDVNATEATDSDADPLLGGMTINEVLVSGESNLTYDAGYYEPASIGNFVWEDLDADGVQDLGEPGLGGVLVTLTGTDGQGNPVTKTTTTEPDGSYLFDELVPGTYKLTFAQPLGYDPSPLDQGGNDATDSDANPNMGGMTVNEVLVSGEYNPNYDAGFVGCQLSVTMGLDVPEICLSVPVNSTLIDFANYLTVVDNETGDELDPTALSNPPFTSGFSIEAFSGTPGTGGSITNLGVYTPGTGSGFVTIRFTLTETVNGVDCSHYVEDIFELRQPVTAEIGSCECSNLPGYRRVDLSVNGVGFGGGLPPYTLQYSGATLDLNGDGVADDTDGTYTGSSNLVDFGQLLLSAGETSWELTIVDSRGCELRRSGSCDEQFEVPAFNNPGGPFCAADGDFEIKFDRPGLDLDPSRVTIWKNVGLFPVTNYPLWDAYNGSNAAPALPGFINVVGGIFDEIQVNPEILLGQDPRYAGIYEIRYTFPATEATNCQEVSIQTSFIIYPNLEPCFNIDGALGDEVCIAAGNVTLNWADPSFNEGSGPLGGLLSRTENQISIWRVLGPNGVNYLENDGSGVLTSGDGGDEDALFNFTGLPAGTYVIEHEVGLENCNHVCTKLLKVKPAVNATITDRTFCASLSGNVGLSSMFLAGTTTGGGDFEIVSAVDVDGDNVLGTQVVLLGNGVVQYDENGDLDYTIVVRYKVGNPACEVTAIDTDLGDCYMTDEATLIITGGHSAFLDLPEQTFCSMPDVCSPTGTTIPVFPYMSIEDVSWNGLPLGTGPGQVNFEVVAVNGSTAANAFLVDGNGDGDYNDAGIDFDYRNVIDQSCGILSATCPVIDLKNVPKEVILTIRMSYNDPNPNPPTGACTAIAEDNISVKPTGCATIASPADAICLSDATVNLANQVFVPNVTVVCGKFKINCLGMPTVDPGYTDSNGNGFFDSNEPNYPNYNLAALIASLPQGFVPEKLYITYMVGNAACGVDMKDATIDLCPAPVAFPNLTYNVGCTEGSPLNLNTIAGVDGKGTWYGPFASAPANIAAAQAGPVVANPLLVNPLTLSSGQVFAYVVLSGQGCPCPDAMGLLTIGTLTNGVGNETCHYFGDGKTYANATNYDLKPEYCSEDPALTKQLLRRVCPEVITVGDLHDSECDVNTDVVTSIPVPNVFVNTQLSLTVAPAGTVYPNATINDDWFIQLVYFNQTDDSDAYNPQFPDGNLSPTGCDDDQIDDPADLDGGDHAGFIFSGTGLPNLDRYIIRNNLCPTPSAGAANPMMFRAGQIGAGGYDIFNNPSLLTGGSFDCAPVPGNPGVGTNDYFILQYSACDIYGMYDDGIAANGDGKRDFLRQFFGNNCEAASAFTWDFGAMTRNEFTDLHMVMSGMKIFNYKEDVTAYNQLNRPCGSNNKAPAGPADLGFTIDANCDGGASDPSQMPAWVNVPDVFTVEAVPGSIPGVNDCYDVFVHLDELIPPTCDDKCYTFEISHEIDKCNGACNDEGDFTYSRKVSIDRKPNLVSAEPVDSYYKLGCVKEKPSESIADIVSAYGFTTDICNPSCNPDCPTSCSSGCFAAGNLTIPAPFNNYVINDGVSIIVLPTAIDALAGSAALAAYIATNPNYPTLNDAKRFYIPFKYTVKSPCETCPPEVITRYVYVVRAPEMELNIPASPGLCPEDVTIIPIGEDCVWPDCVFRIVLTNQGDHILLDNTNVDLNPQMICNANNPVLPDPNNESAPGVTIVNGEIRIDWNLVNVNEPLFGDFTLAVQVWCGTQEFYCTASDQQPLLFLGEAVANLANVTVDCEPNYDLTGMFVNDGNPDNTTTPGGIFNILAGPAGPTYPIFVSGNEYQFCLAGNYTIQYIVGATTACADTATAILTKVAPEVTAPENITISCGQNNQDNLLVILSWLEDYVVDNACLNALTVTNNFNPAIIDYCTGEDIVVTWTATDDCGNTATANATLVVEKDVTPPVFASCPSNFTLNNDVDKCGANATWPTPSAADACTAVTYVQSSGPAQGSFLQVGTVYTIG